MQVSIIKPEDEHVPARRHALDAQGPLQGFGDPTCHRQPKSGSLGADATDPLGPIEWFEYVFALACVQAVAAVLDAEHDRASVVPGPDHDGRPGRAVLHRVVQQVVDELGEEG